MKAAIYCRVSTEDQEREGTSLQSQFDACLKLAEEKGYEVEERYIVKEVYSGLTIERPDLTKLREWLYRGEIHAVIIYDSDRFSRDGYDFVTLIRDCQKANVELLCVTEPIEHGPIGELLSYVRGWASRREADKIKERTARGRKARIASGKLANGKASYLFGYTYIPGNGEGQGIRLIEEKEAETVRRIYHWCADEGLPIDRIVYRLREQGIRKSRAGVYLMLTNPAYAGLAGQHTPAIIDEEAFLKVQAKLKRNKELALRNVKRSYLLRGYVYCKHCGRRYQGALKQYKTKQGMKEYEYYRCSSSFKINVNPCPNHSWKAERLESLIWDEVEVALSNPSVVLAGLGALKDEASKANSYITELDQVESRLSELDKEQEQLLQWALKGFPESTIMQENKRINQSRDNLKERRADIEVKINSTKQAQVDSDSVIRAVELVRANLNDLSFESKRLALEMLNTRIILGKDTVAIEGAIPVGHDVVVSTPSKAILGEQVTLTRFSGVAWSLPSVRL